MKTALSIIAGTLAAVFQPVSPMLPSAWAATNLVVPDGPRKLDRWDASLTPYISEPLDCFTSDNPVNEICVMKSAQTGFSTMLIAAAGYVIDREPADMMIVQPTDGALGDFNSKKLMPAIEQTPSLKERVAPQRARSGEGSTTYEKRFGSYTLTLALASSTADLRSKTVKNALLDEIDEYADDLDGQGSPFDMIEARQESFLKDGTWKRAYVSTPTIKGGSAIAARYEQSDKRRWHVPCPHCSEAFVFEPGGQFVFEREYPYRAHYVAPCCGSIIEEVERTPMIRAGRWIATEPGAGKMRGYHLDALSSPFVPWAKIAERIVKAGDDPSKLKTLYNLTFGLPFEIKGDAPDHERLMERREEGIARGHVPQRGYLLVGAADVQMRGIWCEILAVAPNRESWVVDAFYIDGDTEDPRGQAFELLAEKTVDRKFRNAFGHPRQLDALAIDSGYRSHVVYSFVRERQRPHPFTGLDVLLAVKGMDGWGRPAIGTPSLVDIDLGGKRVRKGAKVWPIGTWPLKGTVYADLRKTGIAAGKERDPSGYCHFGKWLDEGYFVQLTAEHLAEERIRGRTLKRWKLRAGVLDNHFLDCRVYNLALADYLGLGTMSSDEWAIIARRHGLPEEATETNLFSVTAPAVENAPVDDNRAKEPSEETASATGGGWLGRSTEGWVKR